MPATAQLSASVWTDKYVYQVGESVDIGIMVNLACRGSLIVTRPDGAYLGRTLRLAPGIFYVTISADYPLGRWAVLLEASTSTTPSHGTIASTEFLVVAAPPRTFSVAVHVAGFPSNYSANVFVDEKMSGAIPGGTSRVFSFDIDTKHVISVEPYVSGAVGVRYYCPDSNWTVTSKDEHTFAFAAEYRLTVKVEPADAKAGVRPLAAESWYPAGKLVNVTVRLTVDGAPGTQCRFQHLYDNHAGKVMASAAEIKPSLPDYDQIWSMDRPYDLLVRYDMYYFLTVKSEYSEPNGGGWWKAGTTAQFSVNTPVPMTGVWGSLGGTCRFKGWRGDSTGATPIATVVMSGPKSVEAVWDLDYTTPYIAVGIIGALVAIIGIGLVHRLTSKRGPKTERTYGILLRHRDAPSTTTGRNRTHRSLSGSLGFTGFEVQDTG